MNGCGAPWTLAAHFLEPRWLSPACRAILDEPQRLTRIGALEYLFFFFLTCLLEALVYLPTHRRAGLGGQLRIAVLPNLATHPIVFFAIPAAIFLLGGSYGQMLLVAETFAPVVEAWLLWRCWRDVAWKAVATAFGANWLSWTVGTYWV